MNKMLNETTVQDLRDEIVRARTKHPGRQHLLAALMEEVGELSKALLEKQGKAQVRAEATQVACVALRIVEEGDADFDEAQDDEAVSG